MTTRKRIIGIGLIILTAYIASYVVLSLLGGYRLLATGQFRPIVFASPDTYVWQPRYGDCYPFRDVTGKDGHQFDFLGWLFLPLAKLDQKLIHPSRPHMTFQDDGEVVVHAAPPIGKMHPTQQRFIRVTDAIYAKHQRELDAAKVRGDTTESRRIRRQIN